VGDQKVVHDPTFSNNKETQGYKFNDNILDKHVPILIPSSKVFDKLGYEYLSFPDEPSEPEYADVKFRELIPEFMTADGRAREIADKNLYKHQFEAIKALSEGKNVILISGTGSGKTEAWAIYTLKNRLRALAIYPTLALSQDQINRLRSYYAALGLREVVVEVDRPLIDKLGDPKKARELISKALLIITNPAFLMADIKRLASGARSRSRSILLDFLRDVDLIIVDELDYYGSRRATLLLTLIEILEEYVCSKRPQIVVLTATLGNPEELKQYLSQINGRNTEIIKGRAFKVRNFTYLVLGKNLRKIWYMIQSNRAKIEKKIPEITPLIKDFETFRDNVFNVIELLKEHGFKIPELGLDIIEILAEYVKSNEKCVTVVFTPSIRSAETLAKKLRARLKEETTYSDEDLNTIIATHHHLIDVDKRCKIEELARHGVVKVIFTVRTLLQGIDIGTIVRIVHYGLPEDVREFKQREGRKGRRKELPFSETVIVPIKPWGRKVVELGIEGLKEYVSMPLENVFINPNNKYVLMFKAMFKVRKYLINDLTEEERKLLEELKLVKLVGGLFETSLTLSEKGKKIWRDFNFYEFGPPYGVNRILINKQGEEEFIGNNVSRRDLVEKYQPGCFDYSNDAVIVKIRKRNSIIEQDIINAINSRKFLKEAYEQYCAIKRRWGEETDISRDITSGKLTFIVQCYIRVPHNGFGEFFEEPELVAWEIESRKPKVVKFGDEYRIIYESKHIILNSRVKGTYRDFTYGYMYELDPTENVDDIRIGLALLKLILRLSDYKISLTELSYAVEEKPRKLMLIWENDCSGIIESIDWDRVRRFVDDFKPSRICELLLWAIDEDVAVKIIENNISWDEMKKYAHKVLDYIQEVLRLKLKDLGEVRIPKPSKEHKLLSLDVFPVDVNSTIYYIVTSFDGEEYDQLVLEIHECRQLTFNTLDGINRLLYVIRRAIDEGFRVLIYGQKNQLQEVAKNSTTLQILLEMLEATNMVIDVHDIVKKVLGLDIAPIEELEKYLNIQMRDVSLAHLRSLYHNALVKGAIEEFLNKAKEYSKSNAYSTYIMYLIFTILRQK